MENNRIYKYYNSRDKFALFSVWVLNISTFMRLRVFCFNFKNVRNRFFNGSYGESFRFLSFLFYIHYYVTDSGIREGQGDSVLFDLVFRFIYHYHNWFENSLWFNDRVIDNRSFGLVVENYWDDDEFDYLIFKLVRNINLFDLWNGFSKFEDFVNSIDNYVGQIANFFYRLEICKKFLFSDQSYMTLEYEPKETKYLFCSDYFGNPGYRYFFQADSLVFDASKKFTHNDKIFTKWVNYVGSRSGDRFIVSGRFIRSFQIYFNYSDVKIIDSYGANSAGAYKFRPIFKEMYNLPFLVSEMRPDFVNPSAIHRYGAMGRLHYIATYYIQAGHITRFLFDRHLYQHAQIILTIPYRYLELPEFQYIINFGSIFRSRYYCLQDGLYGIVYSRMKIGFSAFDRPYGASVFRIFDTYRLFFRHRRINQILVNIWTILFHLKERFEVTALYSDPSSFPDAEKYDSKVDPILHDSFGLGVPNPLSEGFERIVRRSMMGFAKYLYVCSDLELEWVSSIVNYWVFWSKRYDLGWGTDYPIKNAATEYEFGYKGLGIQDLTFNDRGIVDNVFVDFYEQFEDPELYLYTFFTTIIAIVEGNRKSPYKQIISLYI